MTRQPQWELIANLGDVNPIDFGGYFIFRDKTGVYAEEAELLIAPENEDGEYKVYRILLDRCTLTNGILGDNKYHPEHPAWFAKPESEKASRPQDTTYLSNVSHATGYTIDELHAMFCSDNPIERAEGYRSIGDYHGFENFDEYPLTLKRAEVEKRYAGLDENIMCGRARKA